MGSNPIGGIIYVPMAEWNRLMAQNHWILERDVSGSNPDRHIFGGMMQCLEDVTASKAV